MLHEYSTPAEVLTVAEKQISELFARRSRLVGDRAIAQMKSDMNWWYRLACGMTPALIGMNLWFLGLEIDTALERWQHRLDYAYRMQAVTA